MMQLFKVILGRLKHLLPQNKLRAEYNKMVYRLKTLEAQVEDSAEKLEIAKTSFLKNIYHEIRTPLNSVMGFTSLLSSDYFLSDQEKEEYAAHINQSSRAFLRKMDDIIQASLLEAGMIKVNLEKCNLGEFFEENHTFFSVRKHIAEKNNLVLLCNIDEHINDLDMEFDKFRVTQVLTHLIDNAFKYSDKGIIEYGALLKNDMLEFFVCDNSGRSLQGKEKVIFSRFSKVHLDETDKTGLGLGLSICKGLVELMGGKIGVYTANEKGSKFFFTIPSVLAKSKTVDDNETKNEQNLDAVPVFENKSSWAV
jgi:signal transduction histidine kinase